MNQTIDVAQSKEERKRSVAEKRLAHHKVQLETKNRLDVYVLPETKDALKEIKKAHKLKNEGEAVDKLVEISKQK